MSLREQWIRPLDALPQDYQHVIAITSSGQEEEMYLVDDKWHIVDGVRIPIECVVFWHEKREQPTVEMAEDCISREQTLKCHYYIYDEYGNWLDVVDVSDIERLPSVQPQPKRGEWIPTNDYVTTAYGSLDYYRCSCCGEDSLEEGDYCPNCGCRMDADKREVQDEIS